MVAQNVTDFWQNMHNSTKYMNHPANGTKSTTRQDGQSSQQIGDTSQHDHVGDFKRHYEFACFYIHDFQTDEYSISNYCLRNCLHKLWAFCVGTADSNWPIALGVCNIALSSQIDGCFFNNGFICPITHMV